ncbi:hypothetical protein EW146_g4484 [Bondarzewia mesenterica]|uniref:Uncharacterized protein n=1 Tax=Bondarzewia mesenterica TaxID=1095465 RepID=A0A4S4M084_9AGAM|nr:hypothetical protein EW146_g4484 [Bondarzewia mesenterica]
MHIAPKHLVKRQAADTLPAAPSADGIGAEITASAGAAATSAPLLVTNGAGAVIATDSVPLIFGSGGAITVTSSTPVTSTTSSAPSTSAAASVSTSGSTSISTGTVVGICVGVFAGLAILILIVLWYLKRSAPKPRQRGVRGPTSPSTARNATGEDERRRSRMEPWSRLGDDEDRWEGMGGQNTEKNVDKSAESDKFSMFHKTPSMRTVSDEKGTPSEGHDNFDMSTMPNFAKYHPELAEEFAKAPERPFMGRVDGAPAISWDGETVGDDSFLSLRSVRMSDSGVLPTTVMARQTPPATTSTLHRWESAEVLTMDIADAPEVHDEIQKSDRDENPFADEVQRRKSVANPFFNAQATTTHNPFADANSVRSPRSRRSSVKTRSVSSNSDADTIRPAPNNHAIQSLIAALSIPDNSSAGDRNASSRASMQPSINSELYTPASETMNSFPMPPPTPKAV